MGQDLAAAGVTAVTVPVVTVITPTVNRPNLLRETVQSVLGQTFQNFEYIIGSDGGTEQTRLAVRELMETDDRIRFVDLPKVGQFAILGILISMAKGKYVAILSDDDTWESTFLEKMVAVMESEEYALAYADFYVWFPEKCIKRAMLEPRRCNLVWEGLRHACLVNTTAVLFSRRHLEMVRNANGFYYDPHVTLTCGDWLMWLRLWKFGRFKHVHEPLANYRVHAGQVTNTRRKFKAMLEETHARRFTGVPSFRSMFDVLFWPLIERTGVAAVLRKIRPEGFLPPKWRPEWGDIK